MKEDDGDEFRARLAAMIVAAGTNFRRLSLRLGLNGTYIQQYLKKGTPKKLPMELRLQIAVALGVDPTELVPVDILGKLTMPPERGSTSALSQEALMAPNLKGRRYADLPAHGDLPRDVPVYGVAVGGNDATFRLESQAVDYVRRAPGIMYSKQVFAFYVANDSMEPAWRHGALILCDAGRQPRIGDDVVIELKPKFDGDPSGCLLKRLVRRTADKVIVEQFNPAARIEIPMSEVVRLVRVLNNDDLFGG